MLTDAELMFSTAEVVTATGGSENYLDFKAAHNLGSGEVPKILLQISAVSGTSPTLTAKVQTDDNTAFSSATDIVSTASLAPPVANTLYRLALPSYVKERYMRLHYTVGGTSPSFTIEAGLVVDQQTSPMTGGT